MLDMPLGSSRAVVGSMQGFLRLTVIWIVSRGLMLDMPVGSSRAAVGSMQDEFGHVGVERERSGRRGGDGGDSSRRDRLPDGSVKRLIAIRAWDFRWQDQYRYTTPVFLPKGTTLSMHFTYDNSDRNARNPQHPPRRVKWGPQSTDEMGALWLEILPRHGEDIAALMRDYSERSLRADIAGAEMQATVSPGDALAHNFLATKYLQAGRIQDAMIHLEQALRLKPDDAEAHSNLASALQLQGRLPEAVQHAREAARLKPDDDRVRFNLGNAMSATGNIDDAIREFTRAAQLNPENADAHFNLAMLLGPRNRIDEAIAHLRRALEIDPRNADVHRNLAVALGFKGRIEEATLEAREALRLQPQSVEAQRQLDLLLKARQR